MWRYPTHYPKDPEYAGPGAWLTLHVSAIEADEKRRPRDFTTQLNNVVKYFPCPVCREDTKKFIRQFPPDRWNRGMFDWTVKHHNSVNRRLGKPEYTTQQAYNIYKDLLIEPDTSEISRGCGN